MRILIVHNYYGDGATGGEDAVMKREAALLCAHGHDIELYTRKNSELLNAPLLTKLRQFHEVVWSKASYQDVQRQVSRFKPDLMHVHNFWMVLSPSIFRAAKDCGVATVLTLHNYRLACLGGLCARNGTPCELCIGRNPWRVVLYRCYARSLTGSLARYLMDRRARRERVWESDVDAFIALTGFAKERFVANGLPADRVYVKPNFLDDPLGGRGWRPPGEGAVYAGRLSREKGLATLLAAWRELKLPLTIAGDGPLRDKLARGAPSQVSFVGRVSHAGVLQLLERSAYTVFPSGVYEGFPMAVLESLAVGRATVATDLGPRSELVVPGRTGLLYRPGDPNDLRGKVEELVRSPDRVHRMGIEAREHYLANYTPEANYQRLMFIYDAAHRRNRSKRSTS